MKRRVPTHHAPDGTPVPAHLLAGPDYGGLDPHPDPLPVVDAWRAEVIAWAAVHGWPGGPDALEAHLSEAPRPMPDMIFDPSTI